MLIILALFVAYYFLSISLKPAIFGFNAFLYIGIFALAFALVSLV